MNVGKEAADLKQKNYYVDDLLKPVEDLNTAKTLVKNVIDMCRSGGFSLMKIISISIPEDYRFPFLRKLGNVSVEKAFGIQ